jgi:hypothetical protein
LTAARAASMKEKAKQWLTRMPGVYRVASAAYRSLAVVRQMAYLTRHTRRIMMGSRAVVVTYPSQPRSRWGYGAAGEARLTAVIEKNRGEYERMLRSFAPFRGAIERIPQIAAAGSAEPNWDNGYFLALDAAALYGVIATARPRRLFEIGSGNSTRFARRAIRDQGLPTSLLSIDPSPQADIDEICDVVVRQPLEEVDVALFDQLEAGDILFFDGSHYPFMNSDVVVLWVEILPRLKPGVLVHVHDVFLPYDYPPDWVERFYSEQYLLAVALLAPRAALDVVLPNQFIAKDPALRRVVDESLGPRAADGGTSFWMRTR